MANAVHGVRVAEAIGVIKQVIIGLSVLSSFVSLLLVWLNGVTTTAVTATVVVAALTAGWCLFVWVVFGFFEHALLALISIARNTTAPASTVQQRA